MERIPPECQPPPDAGRHLPGFAELSPCNPAQAGMPKRPVQSPRHVQRDSSRNRSLLRRSAYSPCRAVCRRCGNKRSLDFADDWRSSYKPPVSGPRHYRRLSRSKLPQRGILDVPVFVKCSVDGHAVSPAVVTFLFLVGLPTSVVFVLLAVVVVLSFGLLPGRRCGLLKLAHPRFNFVHEANILVILHHAAGSLIVVATNRARPEIHVPQVAYLHSGEA